MVGSNQRSALFDDSRRFRIFELADGFAVVGNGSELALVTADPFGIEVDWPIRDAVESQDLDSGDEVPESVLTDQWAGPCRFPHESPADLAAAIRFALELGYRADHPELRGLSCGFPQVLPNELEGEIATRASVLAKAQDPVAAEVRRAILGTTGRSASLVLFPEFYEQRYRIRDLQRYPAAAFAATLFDILSRQELVAPLAGEPLVGNAWGVPGFASAGHGVPATMPDALATMARRRCAFELMNDWKALCSPDLRAYRSLNRTLMNLPGPLTPRAFSALRQVHLERPLTNWTEFLTVSCFALASRGWGPAAPANERLHGRIFLNSREDEILRALQEVEGPGRGQGLADRLEAMVLLALDFPESHHGGLRSLVRKAIRYHRNLIADDIRALPPGLAPETSVAKPPIPLPDEPEIRFLATVGEILEEGLDMLHCVGEYAPRAAKGACYLFSVSVSGERATVEVDAWGWVRQAWGPRNRVNAAAEWGAERLSKWARNLTGES